MFLKILLIYLVLINAAAVAVMLADKRKAIKGKWRIPESTLFLLAAAGGSAGSILGMYLFRHKTRHPKFTIGMPLILVFQCALSVLIYIKLYS